MSDEAGGVDGGRSDGAGALDVVVDAREDAAVFFEEAPAISDAEVFKVEHGVGVEAFDGVDEVVDEFICGRLGMA